jgi:hypothetical protein
VDTEIDEHALLASPAIIGNSARQGSNAYLAIESSKLTPLLVALAAVGLALAGLATGLACWALSYADKARMEARILQVKVEGFENALHARGIDPNPHLPGEPL